jgi:hypothetical protein
MKSSGSSCYLLSQQLKPKVTQLLPELTMSELWIDQVGIFDVFQLTTLTKNRNHVGTFSDVRYGLTPGKYYLSGY